MQNHKFSLFWTKWCEVVHSYMSLNGLRTSITNIHLSDAAMPYILVSRVRNSNWASPWWARDRRNGWKRYAALETRNASEAAFSCPNPKKTCVFHVPFWSEKSRSARGYQNDPKWSWVEKEVNRIILRLPPSALYHALKYQILGLVIGMTNCNGGQKPQRLQAFVALDTDGSGEIDYSEFLAPWRRRHPLGFFRKPAECLPVATKSISRHCCYNTRTKPLDESGRYLDDGYLSLTNMEAKAGPFTFPNHFF